MPYEMRKDARRNRLYLRLIGLVPDEEMRRTADEVIEAMATLMPGFTVVVDIAEFRPMSQAGVDQVRRVATAGLQRKMRATARVTGKSQVVVQQFHRVSREGGYPAYTVTSLEEADKVLDDEALA